MRKVIAVLFVLIFTVVAYGQESGTTIYIDSWSGPNATYLTGGWGDAIECVNWEFTRVGGRTVLRTRRGSDSLVGGVTSTAMTGVNAQFFVPNGGAERLYVASDSILYTDGAVWQGVGGKCSGLSPDMQVFKDTLIVTGGDTDSIFAVDSAGLIVDSAAWIYPRVCLHQDRLWFAGIADSVRSKVIFRPEFDIGFDSPDSKTNGGFIYVNKEDGDGIVEIMPLGEYIIVYKSRNIYRIVVSSTTNLPVQVTHVVSGMGAWGHNAVANLGNKHIVSNGAGVFEFDGVSMRKISGDIDRFYQDSIAAGGTYNTETSFLRSFRDKVFCSYLSLNGGYHVFSYDLPDRLWSHLDFTATYAVPNRVPMAKYRKDPTTTAAFTVTGVGLVSGDETMFFQYTINNRSSFFAFPRSRYLDQNPKDDDTSNIHYSLRSAYNSLGSTFTRKSIEDVALIWKQKSASGDTLYMDWYADGSSTILSTDTIFTANGLKRFRPRRLVSGSSIAFQLRTNTQGIDVYGISIRTRVRGKADSAE